MFLMLKDFVENGGLKELGVKVLEIVGWWFGRLIEGFNSLMYGIKIIENVCK